jgi:hypothetical protein
VLRKRLSKKSEECDELRKEAERQAALVGSLQHDRERAVAALEAAKERLKRAAEQGAQQMPPGWAVDASKVGLVGWGDWLLPGNVTCLSNTQ